MYWLAILTVILCLISIIVDLAFLLPTIHGAIYYPSSEDKIKIILELAQIKPSEKAVDIGSGDGRVVLALASAGADAYGFEINPLLVMWSRWSAKKKSIPNVHFQWANLWLTNFSQYQVVTIFGMTYIMKDLEKKLLNELKPGSRVICNSFPFPNWKPKKKLNDVYLYLKD